MASLLLGLAMGWIAVVHRGQRVSKTTSRWLAGLAAALVAAALARVIPGRPVMLPCTLTIGIRGLTAAPLRHIGKP